MRMNISIEGRQQDMSLTDQQRTKRILKALKDVGFDIRLEFSEESPLLSYYYTPLKPSSYLELQEAEI